MYRIARATILLALVPTTTPPFTTLSSRIHTIMSTSQSLPQWFQSRLSAVYDASDESSRSAALDALLAPQVNVSHNGEPEDVADRRHRIMSQTAASSRIDLKWGNVEESAPVRNTVHHVAEE